MLQNMTWCATDNLARGQFHMFSQLGVQMRLSAKEWSDWSDFVQDGPLPAQPQLPVMLRRLGSASHRLAVLADRRGTRA